MENKEKCSQSQKFPCEHTVIYSRVNLDQNHDLTRIMEPIERDDPLGPKSIVCNRHRNKIQY